ncbi:PREDICTED: apolipoprotein L2-like [Chinchilla lanigera]|uniref:apolipoprotein L2-like n=1 Tax=Chinchilla lanigera TaxID=34839 RepID=UPI00038ED9BF|nr:PREDICTED: apolipoprotein L2-like [Chinchilla lanigera]
MWTPQSTSQVTLREGGCGGGHSFDKFGETKAMETKHVFPYLVPGSLCWRIPLVTTQPTAGWIHTAQDGWVVSQHRSRRGSLAWKTQGAERKSSQRHPTDTTESAASPDSNSFIEDVVKCLLNTVSKEDLQQLLTQDEAWDSVKTEAELSREEADELREALKKHTAHTAVEDKDRLQEVQQAKERTLAAFPKLKEEVRKDIEKLRALADQLDQVHRDCTLSSVVAGSTTAASAVLGILGFALAPFTAGASLVLSGAGTVLGLASGVTSISTSIVDYSKTSSTAGEAKSLVSNIMCKLTRFMQDIGNFPPKVVSSTENWSQHLKDIGKTIGSIKQAKGDHNLIISAQYGMLIKNICLGSCNQLNTAVRPFLQVMSMARKALRVVSMAFFVIDMIDLANNSKHLQEGAKSEYAEELRKVAAALQSHLEDLEEMFRLK